MAASIRIHRSRPRTRPAAALNEGLGAALLALALAPLFTVIFLGFWWGH
jgi:hypothetical protein